MLGVDAADQDAVADGVLHDLPVAGVPSGAQDAPVLVLLGEEHPVLEPLPGPAAVDGRLRDALRHARDPAVDRRDPLLDLARPFLESHRPGVASFTAHSAQVQNAWVTVSSNPDGRWSFVSGADPDAALSGLTPDAAIDHVRIELGVLLPEFSPAS